jgi:hypothetical protein
MSDDRGGRRTQGMDQAHGVIDQLHHPVVLDPRRLRRPAVPAYVEGHQLNRWRTSAMGESGVRHNASQ